VLPDYQRQGIGTALMNAGLEECRRLGIPILPPDINASNRSFKVLENSMRFGLGAVKNVGGAAVDAIIEARNAGNYKDLYDFCERVDLRRVNKRVIESLTKCGAFDSTGAKRAQVMAALESAMELGQRIQKERESAQASLFCTAEIVKGNGNGAHVLPDIPEWREKDLLAYEKEALGFYITGHPWYAMCRRKRLTTADTATLRAHKSRGRICGTLPPDEKITGRVTDGCPGDRIGSVEIMVFPTLTRVSEFLVHDPLGTGKSSSAMKIRQRWWTIPCIWPTECQES
jgi:DNA polymerase-3 subunit alpha